MLFFFAGFGCFFLEAWKVSSVHVSNKACVLLYTSCFPLCNNRLETSSQKKLPGPPPPLHAATPPRCILAHLAKVAPNVRFRQHDILNASFLIYRNVALCHDLPLVVLIKELWGAVGVEPTKHVEVKSVVWTQSRAGKWEEAFLVPVARRDFQHWSFSYSPHIEVLQSWLKIARRSFIDNSKGWKRSKVKREQERASEQRHTRSSCGIRTFADFCTVKHSLPLLYPQLKIRLWCWSFLNIKD